MEWVAPRQSLPLETSQEVVSKLQPFCLDGTGATRHDLGSYKLKIQSICRLGVSNGCVEKDCPDGMFPALS